jgi:hypothetical protein
MKLGEKIPPLAVLEKIASLCSVPLEFITKGHLSLTELISSDRDRKKNLNDLKKEELLISDLFPYVERFPDLFDQFKSVLARGNSNDIDTLRAVLRSLSAPLGRRNQRS